MEELLIILQSGFITYDELEEIELDENVESVEFNGMSGLHIGYRWYTVYLDGLSYEVYLA